MLTTIQQEILNGLMLGDGHFELAKAGKNASLRITRTRSDSSYIDHHVDVFFNLGAKRSDGEIKDSRTGKVYFNSRLHTRVHASLTELHEKWYINNCKIVPLDLIITPLTLATWFADDGSIIIEKRNYAVKLSTHGFSRVEVEFLQQNLKKELNLDFKLYQDNSGLTSHWFLMLTNKKSVRMFVNIVEPVFPQGMERKSMIWKNNAELLAEKTYPCCKFCQSNRTFKNGSNKKGQTKYMCKDCNRQFSCML